MRFRISQWHGFNAALPIKVGVSWKYWPREHGLIFNDSVIDFSFASDDSNGDVVLGQVIAVLGPDRLVMCDVLVTLIATIIGNPAGHTFEWEQISGAPVDWGVTDRFQLEVTFAMPDIRDDKTFAFYVDRNTPEQTTTFIDVSSTPTDIFKEFSTDSSQTINADSTQLDILYSYVPQLRTSNTGHLVNILDPTTITWTLPTNINQILSIGLEENTTGIYLPIATLPVNVTLREGVVNPVIGAYRFRVDFTGSRAVRTPSFRVTDLFKNTILLGDDDGFNPSTAASQVILTTTMLTKEILSDEESNIFSVSTNTSVYSSSSTFLTKIHINTETDVTGAPETISYLPCVVAQTYSSITTILYHSEIGGGP